MDRNQITTEAYLAKRFLAFSEECKGRCRLYEVVSTAISEDRELLDLASYAPKSQPIPNLLFASVHYLILTGIQHELRNFYRCIVIIPDKKKIVFSISKAFVCSIGRKLFLFYNHSSCKRM